MLLLAVHVTALATWVGVAAFGQAALSVACHGRDPARELGARRRLQPLLVVEHLALALALGSGFLLMRERGWTSASARWLGLKLGLVVFLVAPLEAMHAYVSHVWIARGLRQTPAPPFSKDLARGVGMDDMVRTLALVLLGAGVPLIVWLSLAKPF